MDERFWESLVSSLTQAVMVINPRQPGNPIVYVNPAFEQLTGYTADEAVGRKGWFLHGDDLDQPALDEIRAALQEERPVQAKLCNYHKDGSPFWVELSLSPVHDAEGRLLQYACVLTDITHSKQSEQAEEEVRRLNTELEGRVHERTEELSATIRQLKQEVIEREMAEAALRQSKYDLEQRVTERTMKLTEVNRRLRRLAQQVVKAQEEERKRLSRELHDEAGQALTKITLSLDLIAEDLPEESAALREWLDETAALAKSTMDQMRRLSHNLRPPELDKLSLNAALENVCRDFAKQSRLTVAYNGASESINVPDTVGTCLYRFLQEALTNIAKHAEASSIRVSLEGLSGPGWVSLAVEDDGKGFDWEVVASGAAPGGIGLKGRQEQFESLGGGLLIESRPGEGTRLVGYLPNTTE